MKKMPDTFSIDCACLQISPFETVILYSFWAFIQIKSPKKQSWNIFLIAALSMLASPQIKTANLPIKREAFLTGRLFCIGVPLNFNSFARNCVSTFPWPGCFKSMLAYLIYPQNTKNPSCVCAKMYLMAVLWKRIETTTCQRLLTTCQYQQLKLNS